MAVYHRTQRLQIYGEKPEVTKLFGDRYRMVVRCKAARDTEAWYNANKDQIFASFGTLYSAQMSVDGIDPRAGEAYPDMCLVSNSASYTQTGEYVISFVYETLTAAWTKEQDDEITSTDNGLRVLQRSEVAKVDGFPIVKLSSSNGSKVVLSGMGNASNYFVLLVKANSANTIYWRATNEALATYTSSFTTANNDQWEYKVLYTPISIDQLEIGYDGTNYSTFDLSEFYVVSQSSDWQNNIVESFINFEVTVDNPSTFTDTVVFTGSNGNTATGTNVQSGDTGSVLSPYDEDDVGVATITDGGKTLYLASFQDQTGAESNAQVGRVVTRWAEAGILNVQTPQVGGERRVTIEALGMTEAEVSSALSEVTAYHLLIDISKGNYEGFQTISYTFEVEEFEIISSSENGLKIATVTSLDTTNFTSGTIGVDTYAGGTLFLASEEIDNNNVIKKRVSRWAEAGILSRTEDFVGSQDSLVIEAIGPDPSTPAGFSLASKQESNYEGFQTNRFTFLKNDVQLSQTEDKVGSQLAISQQWFNPSADKTIAGYSLASKNTSDFEGIETVEYRFLKDDVELSRSEDKVGSQLAIVTEVFKPAADPTESGYSVASIQISDVDGIPTKRFTFLKDDAELSRSEDLVGSQLAITTEVFNPTDDPTEDDYSLARTEVSDVDGIPTKRFTFLKDNVVLSVSEDKVGSQKAIVNEVFNPVSEAITGIDTSGTALTGYSEANRTESDYEGIKTIRVQFLKPSILSLQQEFNNGLKRVSVQVFNLDSAAVSEALSEVTVDHKLIATNESDYEGIKTTTFQYQIDESFTEDYELNGLKRISLIELGATNFTAQDVGSISTTAPTTNLYLGTQSIDNGGVIKVRQSTWLEAGIISETIRNGDSSLPNTRTRTVSSVGVEPTSDGITLNKSQTNQGGFITYSYTFLEGATGGDPTIGTLQTYQTNIDIVKAGIIQGQVINQVAEIVVTPKRRGKVTATVTIELTDNSTVSVPVAYNLDDTSCSATLTQTRVTPIGVEQGNSLTVSVFNTRRTATVRPFPEHYYTGNNVSNSYSTPASIIRDNDNIIGEALDETHTTAVTFSGSNTPPATTGIYDQQTEPVFISADGTQYYRRTTYTIPE